MRRAETSLSYKNDKFCTLERFRDIYREIPTLGTLNFMGDGEPLMNPELLDIIHYAALSNIHTVLTTNGTLLTPRIIEHLVADKVYHIHMSVDAADKDMYEKMRVGADWLTTRHNLELVGRSGIPLCINTVLTQQNMLQMPEIVKLAKEVGAQEVSFLMPICAYGPDTTIRPADNTINRLIFTRTHKLCKDLGIKWIFPLTLNPTFRRFSFPFIRPEISVEGDLWACCYSLGRGTTWMMGEEIHIKPGTYVMGNMFRDGFKEVWYGSKYKALRQKYIDTEIPKGTIITREEYVRRIREVEGRENSDQFAHCEICPARWGAACS
jgi:MoaA/NifB/PqqE/SkfB family radical SAM enzyme